jgi:hypothetical protein
VLKHRDLFLLHERNLSAFEQLERSEHHHEEHDDLEQELRRFLASPAIPVAQRVRMACSIGAVMGALMGAGEVFGDVPTAELAGFVRDAVRDLLGSNEPATRAMSTRRPPRPTRR